MSAEPGAAELAAVATPLRRAAALVRAAGAGVDAAILAQEDLDSVRIALSEADRFARRAVDESLRANEALIDTAERLGVSSGQLVDPRTDQAVEDASERVNEASTEVAVALGSVGG